MGDLILLPLVRGSHPAKVMPLVALDLSSGEVRWHAIDPEGRTGGCGSMRCRAAVVNGEVVFAAGYSSSLYAVSAENGALSWSVPLGRTMFQHYASPVVRGRSVYLGRHEGYLHKVDAARRHREWSVYLGHHQRAGAVVSANQALPEFAANAAWSSAGSSPILSTPALDQGRLYLGTEEGFLYCLANLGDDDAVS